MPFSVKKVSFFIVLFFFVWASFLFAIDRVSVNDAGVEGNNTSNSPSISSDGRYIAFSSSSTNLVGGDTNGAIDSFVYDRDTDTIERISVSSLGVEGNGASGNTSISADGRYVAFVSTANNLVAGDTNLNNFGSATASDIFVYDRNTDTIERVSINNLGVEADNDSYRPFISADGRYVVFESWAQNLDTVGHPNGVFPDIFVYDRDTDTINQVSVDDTNDSGNQEATHASVSSDGRYVAFQSGSNDLVAGDTNAAIDVFVFDRDSNTIERVSLDDLGGEGDTGGGSPMISADGRYVAFSSESTDLVAGDTNGVSDIFVYDRNTDTIERVSLDYLGGEADSASESPAISGDGRYVVFDSLASDLVAGDTNGVRDAFVYDRNTDTTQRLSVNGNLVEGDGSSGAVKVSSDGVYVVFDSDATNIISGDTNAATDVFVRPVNNSTPTNITLTPQTFAENQPSGTTVGALTTTDADVSDTHTYTLACTTPGANDASFSISGSNLVSAQAFNYEDITSYAICIRTSDGNGGTYDENFTITITDVDEGSTGSGGGPTDPPVLGCTDDDADNFDSNADTDDGSCLYIPGAIEGCTDSSAGNYDPDVTVDDGSCLYGVFGCMDSTATNYNPLAEHSSLCQYTDVPDDNDDTIGCMNSGALNFNPNADINDENSCDYLISPIDGCTDPSADNYDSGANQNDGSCLYAVTIPDEDVRTPIANFFDGSVSGISGFVRQFPEEEILMIAVGGFTISSILVSILQPGLIAGAVSIPIRLWNLVPVLMGYRRKKRPWGTVYDSVTKQPLDPVYVTLKTSNGMEQGTSITDLDGRYGFLTEAGTYTISANKANYIFPSTKLADKTKDDLYDNLYFGGPISLSEKEGVVFKNIPMDAINFNWNEFTKAENKKLMKFYSKRDLFFARTANLLFVTGFISSVILFFINISTLNTVILSLYALILILRFFGIKPKQSGYVFDEKGFPLSFGIIKLFSAGLNREVSHTVIGKTGKYYALVPNGDYYMKVMKKTGEDSYQEVLQTDSFKVKGGFVDKRIVI